jgi:hypothetical protein
MRKSCKHLKIIYHSAQKDKKYIPEEGGDLQLS